MKPTPSFDELEALITMKMEEADSHRKTNPKQYRRLKTEARMLLEDLQEHILTVYMGR
jgi:hypothetical protein